MAYNKIIYGGNTLIDLTNDTITANVLLDGYTAHDKSGTAITGIITVDPTPTISGATVTIPIGYYSSNTTKTISNGSATTPATTVTATQSISIDTLTGKITATASGSKSVIPTVSAGYVSTGTAGTITVNGSDTLQLTAQAATIYNTSTSNQTIAAGTYLTGAQTIRAVTTSNLSAENVASGVTITVGDSADADRIVSVTGTFTSDATATADDIISGETAYINGREVIGTLVVNNYYTGSTAPSSSLGSNGDIYFQS